MGSVDNKNNNNIFDPDYDNDLQSYLDNNDDEYKKSFKLYNFRRPDKFSKENLKGLQDLHRDFSRQLSLNFSAYLRIPIEIDVVSVDQLTYDEFVRSMPTPITIGILEFRPLPGQVLYGISFEVLSAIVDRMLGGVGICENINRELTDIEESLATKLIERTIKTLEKTWSKILTVSGHIIGLDKDYSMIQIVSASEIVALITFEIQISGKYFGLMSFCFTYPFLENILPLLTTQHIYQTRGLVASVEEQQQMVEKIDTSTVDVDVTLGHADITTRDFLALKEGDVIRLNERTTDDLIVSINKEKKFFARPGKIKNKICVKISEVYDDKVNILKKY